MAEPNDTVPEQVRPRRFKPAGSGGSRKGIPNKVGKAAKDIIAGAAEALGGQDRLVKWAKEAPENEKAFWASVYPKLLPLQLTGEGGGPVRVQEVRQTIVDP